MRPAAFALLIPLALAACGDGGDASVGGVSPSEAQALNDAAEMLDERAANSAATLPATPPAS
jgi:hypothetical protein